ncbi:MAG: TetR/AcrR family transcriptional regulator [Acidobacteriota bacterium]|nr:TetR/AcrR family transcriptional regulator [Acidobacteriota bacterium]
MVQIVTDPILKVPETAHAIEQKRRILEAASRVFRRQGLHATGMRDIAAELDMHAGNLYYYFRNKHDLLAFCQEEALTGLLEAAEEILASDAPTGERLGRLIVVHVERVNEQTPGSLAHLEVEALEEPWRRAIQERRDAYERVYRLLIERGVEEGCFQTNDPRVAAMAILGALNWTVKWYRPGGRKDASEIGREFAELLVAGLTARAKSRDGSH